MKLTQSKHRSWFAAAAGMVATVALPAAAQPPAQPADRAVTQEGLAAEGQPTTNPDGIIVGDIRTKFEDDPVLKRSRINIVSQNGVVTLTGGAPTGIARDRAVQYARETAGVFRVDNLIRLDVTSPEAPVPP
jgi:hyperosmotically inducible periplasmic protein